MNFMNRFLCFWWLMHPSSTCISTTPSHDSKQIRPSHFHPPSPQVSWKKTSLAWGLGCVTLTQMIYASLTFRKGSLKATFFHLLPTKRNICRVSYHTQMSHRAACIEWNKVWSMHYHQIFYIINNKNENNVKKKKENLLLVSSHNDYTNIKNNLYILIYIKLKQTSSFEFFSLTTYFLCLFWKGQRYFSRWSQYFTLFRHQIILIKGTSERKAT